MMEYASLIVLLALVQYVYFSLRVGAKRGKYKVDAPACSGNENWERNFRVQQNTLEQLVIMIPGTFLFAWYVSPGWVLLPGIVFILGRFLYSAEYIKEPKSRAPGMGVTLLANASLVVGALIGVVMKI